MHRRSMLRRVTGACLGGAAWFAASGAWSAPAGKVAYQEIGWDALVPKDWDPMKSFKSDPKAGMLSDSDPKVLEMMRQLREVWDNAPTTTALNGQAVKLPGYVVPLEEAKGELSEFLLVPYFGACIHTPPPPANQIVHVRPAKPVKGFKTMDTVWVSGTLNTSRQDSMMGVSGYALESALVQRYTEAAR
jgi:hypothetical protein